MLDLASTRWNELRTAYGTAANIPQLILQLQTAPRPQNYGSEPWYSLWSSLCHQSDVFSASYAAVPHFAAIAAKRPVKDRPDFLLLVASIEAYRHRKSAPEITEELKPAYEKALLLAKSLVIECLNHSLPETDLRILLAGLAVLNGNPKLGLAVLDLNPEITCPLCEKDFRLPAYDLFE